MSQTAILVKELRDLADAIERLDAEQPLPSLYVTVSTPLPGSDPTTAIQVSLLADGLLGKYEWATDAERIAAAERIKAATGRHAYAPIAEPVSA